MSKTTDIVSRLAQPVVEKLGLELWSVEFLREGGVWVLRVTIDLPPNAVSGEDERPAGVNINHCEAVSRALEPLLDEADPIEQSYVLQVSSAGLERALKRPSDFTRFLGHTVELSFYKGKTNIVGSLEAYDGETITVDAKPYALKEVAQVRLRAIL